MVYIKMVMKIVLVCSCIVWGLIINKVDNDMYIVFIYYVLFDVFEF